MCFIIINIVIISNLKFRICSTGRFQSPVAIGDLFRTFVRCNYALSKESKKKMFK